jgi:hypothetical protein
LDTVHLIDRRGEGAWKRGLAILRGLGMTGQRGLLF